MGTFSRVQRTNQTNSVEDASLHHTLLAVEMANSETVYGYIDGYIPYPSLSANTKFRGLLSPPNFVDSVKGCKRRAIMYLLSKLHEILTKYTIFGVNGMSPKVHLAAFSLTHPS